MAAIAIDADHSVATLRGNEHESPAATGAALPAGACRAAIATRTAAAARGHRIGARRTCGAIATHAAIAATAAVAAQATDTEDRTAVAAVAATAAGAANRLRATMAAVRLSFTWLGVRKTLAPEQRTTAARAFHADRELLSASKLILDTKNPAYRAVAAVRSEASGYWRTVTLPFPEAGIRLLPQNSLGMFASTMQTYRERLQEAARELASQYDTIKSEAQRRLGTLFNASDYPSTLDGLFDLEVSYPTIEPPNYLMALHPDVYQQEQARVRERFESAVELAEQAFATELQRLTAHLAERLTGLHDGQPKVFRDSAVENLRDFFERFRRLNIRSSPELDALVEQAQQTISGVEPQTLRDSNRLRQMVARDFEQIQAAVGDLLVDRPRRNILRRGQMGAAV